MVKIFSIKNVLLFLLLGFSIVFSFLKYYDQPMEGDLVGGVVPHEELIPLFEDPFGFKFLFEDKRTSNPNRFVPHYVLYIYYNYVPIGLNNVFDPVESLYISNAIFKLLVQFLLISLLAYIVSIFLKEVKYTFIIPFGILIIIFQIGGYYGQIGLVDRSPTFVFFYGLPAVFLLWLIAIILIYFRNRNEKLSWLKFVLLIFILVVISFSGPIAPPILLLLSLLWILWVSISSFCFSKTDFSYGNSVLKDKKVSVFVGLSVLLPLYSIWLNSYNALNIIEKSYWESVPLLIRGIINNIFLRPAFPILISIVVVNLILSYKFIGKKYSYVLLKLLFFVVVFSTLYLLLLPFGGYREYRPYFIRQDTLVPVILCLFFIFSLTSTFVILNIKGKEGGLYAGLISFVLVFFFYKNFTNHVDNSCEKRSIYQITKSDDLIVDIEDDCKVLSWAIIENPKDTEINSLFFQKVGITKEKKYYFNK